MMIFSPGYFPLQHTQLTELRAALNVLGLSLQGNKYDMVERLISHNMVSMSMCMYLCMFIPCLMLKIAAVLARQQV